VVVQVGKANHHHVTFSAMAEVEVEAVLELSVELAVDFIRHRTAIAKRLGLADLLEQIHKQEPTYP